MSIKNRNGYGKGTFIETDMIISPAYLALTAPAIHADSIFTQARFQECKIWKGEKAMLLRQLR